MFLEHEFLLPLTAGLMVEVIGPAAAAMEEVDPRVTVDDARDSCDTLDRLEGIVSAAGLLPPMASLEYLILVYSRVIF